MTALNLDLFCQNYAGDDGDEDEEMAEPDEDDEGDEELDEFVFITNLFTHTNAFR